MTTQSEPRPVRVKVYGLLPLTRRQYLRQAVIGLTWLAVLLLAWWLGWPALRDRLRQLELPPTMAFIIAVLEAAPWILLTVALIKAFEMFLVLRCFARQAGAARPPSPAPLETSHGQGPLPPVSQAGRGSEAANP